MDVLIEVNDTVLHDSLQLLLVDTKGRLDFLEGVEEVFSHDLHLVDVVRERSEGADFDVAVEGETGRALDETADLGTRKVLRQGRELHQVDVGSHDAILAHLGRVNGENLDTTVLVWQRDLDMDLETTGAKERLIDHVEPVRHSDQQNVVQLIHTVHLRAMDPSHGSAVNAGNANRTWAARTLERSWLTTESPTPVPLFVEPRCLQIASSSSKMMMWRPDSSPFSLYCTVAQGQLSRPPLGKANSATNLLFGVREQLPDVLFRLSDEFVEDLGTVDDLGLARVEHFADLPRHQRFAGTRRTVQENTCGRDDI